MSIAAYEEGNESIEIANEPQSIDMIECRTFRNDDLPGMVAVWKSQPPQRGLAQHISTALLERIALSKPYFDPRGLIVAVEEGRVVGFAHAGFGPNEDFSSLSTEMGVTAMLLVAPHENELQIAAELLRHSEDYLRARGAGLLYGGGIWPINPFYLGLYGGSELPGVLASDKRALEFYRQGGYEEIDRCLIFQRRLAGFRPVVDRFQVQIRRRYRVEAMFDPPLRNWWEASQWAMTDRVWLTLSDRGESVSCGEATFWDIEPLAANWGAHAVGLLSLRIDEDRRRQGLATFLVGESLKQLQAEGAELVEAQTMQSNAAAAALYRKLGFDEVDQGIVLRKAFS